MNIVADHCLLCDFDRQHDKLFVRTGKTCPSTSCHRLAIHLLQSLAIQARPDKGRGATWAGSGFTVFCCIDGRFSEEATF